MAHGQLETVESGDYIIKAVGWLTYLIEPPQIKDGTLACCRRRRTISPIAAAADRIKRDIGFISYPDTGLQLIRICRL